MTESDTSSSRPTPPASAQIEGIKLLYDFFKHLTTMSVGCILVLATFAKSLAQLQKPMLAQYAVLGFSACILGSLIIASFYAIRGEIGDFSELKGGPAAIAALTLLATAASLVFAIASLGLFAVANLEPPQ